MPHLSLHSLIKAVILGSAYAFSPSSKTRGAIAGLTTTQPCNSFGAPETIAIHGRRNGLQQQQHRMKKAPSYRSFTSYLPSESKTKEQSNDNDGQSANRQTDATNVRKPMALLSLLGLLETTYLTYDKLHPSESSLVSSLCSTDSSSSASSCTSVLNGPYASFFLGDTEIPLALLGMMAYATVFVLTYPILFNKQESSEGTTNNRIALLGISTLMGTFSVYLVSLILGVLHTTCAWCFVSAGCSISLAGFSWFGGILPSMEEEDVSLSREIIVQSRKNGVITGLSSFGVATLAALLLFLNVEDESSVNSSSYSTASTTNTATNTGTLLASSSTSINYESNIPTPITTKSSPQALRLASDLSSLHSKMYGAFWCSHCYDQKQSLGLQAMQSIPYVECDREGYRNERELCREREVPGYPTWEIGGELFPGERSLEELREIVDDVLRRKGGV